MVVPPGLRCAGHCFVYPKNRKDHTGIGGIRCLGESPASGPERGEEGLQLVVDLRLVGDRGGDRRPEGLAVALAEPVDRYLHGRLGSTQKGGHLGL